MLGSRVLQMHVRLQSCCGCRPLCGAAQAAARSPALRRPTPPPLRNPCALAAQAAITTRILGLVHELCAKRIHVTKRDLFYTDVKLFEVRVRGLAGWCAEQTQHPQREAVLLTPRTTCTTSCNGLDAQARPPTPFTQPTPMAVH